jgi:DNA-binding NarL/FixJ family response regulator
MVAERAIGSATNSPNHQAATAAQSRFAVPSDDFAARTEAIDTLLAPFSVVCGTGSWIEAHLVARLGHVQGIPNLLGCGITAAEVVELCQRAPNRVLVILTTSIAPDHGIALCLQLKALGNKPSICCLIDQHNHLALKATLQCDALVNAASFGSGVMHDALLAISQGQSYLDPSISSSDAANQAIVLKPREQQVLELLALGMSNKAIGSRLNIAAVTVRDYVQQLCRKLDATNRTDVVFKATCSGLL